MHYWMLTGSQGNLSIPWLQRFHWFFNPVNLKIQSSLVLQVMKEKVLYSRHVVDQTSPSAMFHEILLLCVCELIMLDM